MKLERTHLLKCSVFVRLSPFPCHFGSSEFWIINPVRFCCRSLQNKIIGNTFKKQRIDKCFAPSRAHAHQNIINGRAELWTQYAKLYLVWLNVRPLPSFGLRLLFYSGLFFLFFAMIVVCVLCLACVSLGDNLCSAFHHANESWNWFLRLFAHFNKKYNIIIEWC